MTENVECGAALIFTINNGRRNPCINHLRQRPHDVKSDGYNRSTSHTCPFGAVTSIAMTTFITREQMAVDAFFQENVRQETVVSVAAVT